VVLGKENTILTSRDGVNWTVQTLGGNNYTINAVAYGNGRFVAVGYFVFPGGGNASAGAVFTSSDGITWTKGTAEAGDLTDVAYGNGLFVAVGRWGALLTSRDGITWAKQPSGTYNWLYGVAYGNGRFVVVGGGVILTSP